MAVDESVGVVATDAAAASFIVSVQERVNFAAVFFARLLWELIPDDQQPDWQVFNSNGGTGWALVDDDQTQTWQNVSTTGGTGWSEIDTDPGTNWNKINTV